MIHPKTLLISRHFYSLESYVWRSIYNLKIVTISTYDLPLDRSFLKLWNGIRHVMPSTDRRLELKEKTSLAQNAWQAFVYANGLRMHTAPSVWQIVLLFFLLCGISTVHTVALYIYFLVRKVCEGSQESIGEVVPTPWKQRECGGRGPLIPNLGGKWVWVASRTPRPIYPRGKVLSAPID